MTTQDKNQKSTTKKVAIVGAGVSGLAAAYKLKSHGVSVTVYEAEGRLGGKLKSESSNGLIWDDGANTMTASEVETQNLIDSAGLVEKQQFPISQHKRYIVRNGEPVLIPNNPIELIGSNILSVRGKLQLVLEPFLWKKRAPSKFSDSSPYESVGMFFQRHFGKEVVDYLIDPFVAGTAGADPESLSAQHSFPSLWNLETRFGSVVSGAIMAKLSSKSEKSITPNESKDKRKRQRGSFSFVGGMQTLAETLGSKLETTEVSLQSKVLSLSYNLHENSPLENWSVSFASKSSSHTQNSSYDAIVVTAPISDVKQIKFSKNRSSFPLNFLPEVVYMPLSVIITAFRKDKVKKPLEGFGVLVPSKEQQNGLQTLGTLFSSSMFPDRAPNDLYLYTTFVGGSRNVELAKAASEKLKDVVSSDLQHLLGAEGEPVFFRHLYWSKAFPLYGKDYGAVLEGIEKMEKSLPGFFYAGNHRDGLAVGKALASGCKAADRVMSYLEAHTNLV